MLVRMLKNKIYTGDGYNVYSYKAGQLVEVSEATAQYFLRNGYAIPGNLPAYMDVITIGFIRDDGDIEVLATLNNTGDYLDKNAFMLIAHQLKNSYSINDVTVELFERQDAPDIVTPEEVNDDNR